MFRKFCFRKQAAGGFRRRGPTRRAFARCVRCRCTGFFSAVGRACLARHGAALIVGLAAPRRPRRQPRRLQLLVLGLRLPAASCLVGVALQPHIVAAWRSVLCASRGGVSPARAARDPFRLDQGRRPRRSALAYTSPTPSVSAPPAFSTQIVPRHYCQMGFRLHPPAVSSWHKTLAEREGALSSGPPPPLSTSGICCTRVAASACVHHVCSVMCASRPPFPE